MNSTISDVAPNGKTLLHRIKFGLLLGFQIPAIILSLVIFLYFTQHRSTLKALHNQALLALLVVNFIQVAFDIPFPIRFYQTSQVEPATPTYCTWWSYLEYSLDVTGEVMMAVISVQRHVLIFHSNLLRNMKGRLLLHYIPLFISIIYAFIFYLFVILLYPCDGSQWDYTNNACGFAACYFIYTPTLGLFDWAFNNGTTMIIIVLTNIALLIRVNLQKRRLQRDFNWRQQRRMVIQLLAISNLYIVSWSPSLIVGLIHQVGYVDFLADVQLDYFYDLIYCVCLFLPWVCLGLLPELFTWLKQLFNRHQATVNVLNTTIHRVETRL